MLAGRMQIATAGLVSNLLPMQCPVIPGAGKLWDLHLVVQQFISFHILKQKEGLFSAAEQTMRFLQQRGQRVLAGGQPQPWFSAMSTSVWVLPALGSDPGPWQGDGAGGPCGVQVQWPLLRISFSSQPLSRGKQKDEQRKRWLQFWQRFFWPSETFLEDASLGWMAESTPGLPWKVSPIAACCGTCVPEAAWSSQHHLCLRSCN